MEIPTSVYALIGFLIFSNFSTLGALIVFIFKVGKFVANTEYGIKDARDTAVRAHKRLDKIEEKVVG